MLREREDDFPFDADALLLPADFFAIAFFSREGFAARTAFFAALTAFLAAPLRPLRLTVFFFLQLNDRLRDGIAIRTAGY